MVRPGRRHPAALEGRGCLGWGGMLASFYLSSDDPVVGIFDKLQWRVAKAEAAQALKDAFAGDKRR